MRLVLPRPLPKIHVAAKPKLSEPARLDAARLSTRALLPRFNRIEARKGSGTTSDPCQSVGTAVGCTLANGSVSLLSSIEDVNSWLGQSQFEIDPGFAGSIHELRLYSVALSATDIESSFAAGPDVLPDATTLP